MTFQQIVVFLTLGVTLFLLAAGKFRYDLVSVSALAVLTVFGIMPSDQAFAGFGNPAVITVAAILVISEGLMNAGIVDSIANYLIKICNSRTKTMLYLTTIVTILSAFMNNVGALALMLPVAIKLARKNRIAPSFLLMPLSFGSLLGGQLSLIGTPPNMIVSTIRNTALGAPYRMFDFTLVGLGVAAAGVAFIVLVGWRFIPYRKGTSTQEDMFEIKEGYFTELYVTDESPLIGKKISDISLLSDTFVTIVCIEDDKCQRSHAPHYDHIIHRGDILLVQATQQDMRKLITEGKLLLVGSKISGESSLKSGDVTLAEAVVSVNSPMVKQTVQSLNLRYRYGVNLIAVARQGERLRDRLRSIRFKPGDILLLQGHEGVISETLQSLGCLPLAERDFNIPREPKIWQALGIFGSAIALTTFGLMPVHISFTLAAIVMILTNMLTLKEAYSAMDFPILIFLGTMIQVGKALELTGGSELVANQLLKVSGSLNPVLTLALLMIATMALSNIINTAASAVLMAPIALNIAAGLGVSADPFLMAVVVSASFAFLTPIHQSNILVMGPGGYHFGDYWKMGLPLQFIGLIVGIPLLLLFWPM
jgi:di/tricarboxylate transporter